MNRVKLFFAVVVSVVLFGVAGEAYGQMRPEHRWLVGNWTAGSDVAPIVFSNDGSFNEGAVNGFFSIASVSGDFYEIIIFRSDGRRETTLEVHRINDNRFILRQSTRFTILNKRN